MWWQQSRRALTLGIADRDKGAKLADAKSLRSLAREVAELALSLAALSDGQNSSELLSEVEYIALKILKEASVVRTANVRPLGETRGAWRIPQPDLLPR
jgi:hypothetical protein